MQAFCQDNLEWLSPIEFKQKEDPQISILEQKVDALQSNDCKCDPTLADRLKSLEEKYNALEKRFNELMSSQKQPVKAVEKPKTTSVPAIIKNKIVMYTSLVCRPCKVWKEVDYPKFVNSKIWDVEIKPSVNGLPTPNYEVRLGNGPTTTYVGYLSFEAINK